MAEITNGYFEEYSCGCVSEIVRRKRDLTGYCGTHGNDRRHVHRVHPALVKMGEEERKERKEQP